MSMTGARRWSSISAGIRVIWVHKRGRAPSMRIPFRQEFIISQEPLARLGTYVEKNPHAVQPRSARAIAFEGSLLFPYSENEDVAASNLLRPF